MKTILIRAAVILGAFVPIASLSATDVACPVTVADLKRMNLCELHRLFEEGRVTECPHGYGRGHVLYMADAHFPKLRARLAGSAWKGKHFEDCCQFINQWPGFKALRGSGAIGTSWHDDKPCLVLEYPPKTPIFGKTRDELREVAPGLYLARLYETCPCPHFRGYFALQVCGNCP